MVTTSSRRRRASLRTLTRSLLPRSCCEKSAEPGDREGSKANMTSQHTRNYSGSSQHAPAGYNYETLQSPGMSTVPPQSMASSPQSARKPEFGIDDGDIAMEDADPYNRVKYSSRQSHSQHQSPQYLGEESTAARRYSPMNTFSPTSPYTASSPQQSTGSYNAYTPQPLSARQSPSRSNPYSTPAQPYYPSNRTFTLRVRRVLR